MAFKLKPNPTFRAKVGIPIPGGDPELVEFEFRHRTLEGLQSWQKECDAGMTNRELFDSIVVGWGLTDEFNADNSALLLQNYPGSIIAISRAYIGELTNARLGN
jgi:hypothetical protein